MQLDGPAHQNGFLKRARMPYRDPEKQKEYYAAYAQGNKHKRNAAKRKRRALSPGRVREAARVAVRAYRDKYPDRHKAANRRSYVKNRKLYPEKNRAGTLRYRYDLTLEQHRMMYLAQNGCCAICGKSVPYDKMATDHDHNTGRVRGLLCNRCNIRIGIFDEHDLLEKALNYLEEVS